MEEENPENKQATTTVDLVRLGRWKVQDERRAQLNLRGILSAGVPRDLFESLVDQLDELLPTCGDSDRALTNLERFVQAARSPLALGALLDRDRTALPILVTLFSNSQHLSDVLIREPEGYDLLRLTDGQPVARQLLLDDIKSEIETLRDERLAMAAMRRFKQREVLRIAYGDLVVHQQLDVTTRQLSYLADALCHAAVCFARNQLEERFGVPVGQNGQPAKFCVLALGKLGGNELNYSSDIDLIMFYDLPGETTGVKRVSNQEFFERLSQYVTRLLGEATESGAAYRVDLRLRPHGKTGPLANSRDGLRHYYDLDARTWERQAFVKARAIAGDVDIGERFLKQLQSWIYPRFLSYGEIGEIRSLKRRIEQRVCQSGQNDRNVKTGIGGIRDIEFTIQFLQLLNGSDLESLRTGNTLDAIRSLAEAGCLTSQEATLLVESYVFLRTVEHRLQILFDLQTHELPADSAELRRLAIRLGYVDEDDSPANEKFQRDYREKTEVNRKILNFLLHDAFSGDGAESPEAELILDPAPDSDRVCSVLEKYGFDDVEQAFSSLLSLSQERVPFLSQRRCRHFLTSIAQPLLQSIAATPDPDGTLLSLEQVAASVGGKGLLWELFSYNPASLELCIRMCGAGTYLSGLLTSQPGMIDELMDSLMLDRLADAQEMRSELSTLTERAEDIQPILQAFKSTQHLQIGVRDLLGKEEVAATHLALSDTAEAILGKVVESEYHELVARHGHPMCQDEPQRRCPLVILALGKLGGQEPNYHSDLDVVFLYEEDGATAASNPSRVTTNQHFFSQLSSKVVARMGHVGPAGRLYEVDARLRPTGRSGMLVVSIAEFCRYFSEGDGQLWERLALCKARPVFGEANVIARVMDAITSSIFCRPWQPTDASEMAAMRYRLEETASAENLKRGVGGTMDVEFGVQLLQLRWGEKHPTIMVPGTLPAIQTLMSAGVLSAEIAALLGEDYSYLRSIESRLRLLNTTARHDLPQEPKQLKKLAYIVRSDSAEQLLEGVGECRKRNRAWFLRTVEALAQESS